ncbi:unnamed protein product [Leptidea sinapis]|uniref:Uncharacterized protein n=1 Tax=Leptidea sinapis TaxID=189913 RepID=A0A5E4PQS1_9NEOP|nr:unnamed protein product [Leptidea sinapis]
MEHNIINTLKGDRVSSTYAEIYFDDTYCNHNKSDTIEGGLELSNRGQETEKLDIEDEWTSPSDLLVGIIELKPPFTSKINRGKTHEGICRIGNELLKQEHSKFLKSLNKNIAENDAAWEQILKHESEKVTNKVKVIYDKIFKEKSLIMSNEISKFYESNLQELEDHIRSEVQMVLESSQANIISTLNAEIREKLKQQKKSLEDILRKRLLNEVKKINHYYSLLLGEEIDKNEYLINNALIDKNDTLNAFVRLMEADKITSNMYVMSLERKKCKVKRIILKNYHNEEIQERIQKIKERRDIIEDYKTREKTIPAINKEWTENINKILQLFLKFIGFSLKLLPEQSTFLLDLEKLVILQLNEIQKQPDAPQTLLLDESNLINEFNFVQKENEMNVPCENEPFTLVGDLSDPIPPQYGSRETLASNVDLPSFRVQRQFVYAKCHGFEDIKKVLDVKTCPMCHYTVPKSDEIHSSDTLHSNLEPTLQSTEDITTLTTTEYTTTSESTTDDTTTTTDSTTEDTISSAWLLKGAISSRIPMDDHTFSKGFLLSEAHYKRSKECPARSCMNWLRKQSFLNLKSYVNYSDDNYARVTAILGKNFRRRTRPVLMRPKDIVYSEPPFFATKEKFHTVETQCSSAEDLDMVNTASCTCIASNSNINVKDANTSDIEVHDAFTKRKISLQHLFNSNPELLKLFTDECYDKKI